MFDGGWASPFDALGLDDAEDWLSREKAEREKASREKARRGELLDAHIDRLWNALPSQSQRRLGVIAASAGTNVGTFEHGSLVGALGLVAEAEGTLEVEREFAEAYLGVEWVAEAVAEAERRRSEPSAGSRVLTEERREQNRIHAARFRERAKERASQQARKKRERAEERMQDVASRRAIAVDGEGVTVDGEHIYKYLAACRSDGKVLGELYDPQGILTGDAIDFLAGLPKADEDGVPYLGIFGYGLGYDLTKCLEGLSNRRLFRLIHGENAEGKVKFERYQLMLLGKCFEIVNRRAPKGLKKTLVWDILKGFQSTFVKALQSWEVGSKEQHQRIEDMKKQRGNFATVTWKRVTDYCKEECVLLAQLTEKYIRAHVEAGIDLRGKYHGAGSTSDAFLTLMDALSKRCTREVEDEDLDAFGATKSAFSRAFFGGRAEISRLGIVQGPVWTGDIASAYPHALFDLPCVKHGKWRHVRGKGVGRAVQTARLACVHHRIDLERDYYAEEGRRIVKRRLPRREGPVKKKDWSSQLAEVDKLPGERAAVMGIQGDVAELAWGPLPYRTENGCTVFPAAHPGGWAWAPEYTTAKRLFDGVRASEAWVLRSDCQCDPPYRDIGMYYLRRLEWGGSKGKVLKLGMNGCYGKFAQVIGRNPKYSCRVIAGQITATTRARMVEGIMSQKDPWDVIYAATDGLIATSELVLPNPPENETVEGATKKGKAWLGSWEIEPHKDSLFVVQPGFYFSLEPKGKARTRGTPLEVIDEYRDKIIEQWRAEPTKKPSGLPKQDVFHGIKMSIRPPTSKNSKYRRKSSYGKWSKEDRKINYVVNPKRSDLVDLGNGSFRLMTWWLSPHQVESAEYKKDASFKDVDGIKDDQPDFVEPLVRGVGEDD